MTTTEDITTQLYSKIPKWMFGAIGAIGKEGQGIEDLTDLLAEAFKLGYDTAFQDMRKKVAEIKAGSA